MAQDIQTTAVIVLKKRDKSLSDIVAEMLPEAIDARPLSTAKAFEFDLDTITAPKLQARLLSDLNKANIQADVCVMPRAGRKKKLLICDMDSTLIGQECIDELADFAGVKDKVSAITERAMRGEIGFDAALKERVGMLKNLPLSVLQDCYEQRISLNPGARVLAQTMKSHGAKTVIVSGGFTFFTGHIAKAAGFDADQANTLIDDGTALTGEVGLPILGREAKLDALKAHSKDLGGPKSAIAIGDGANDLAMITAAGLGVAFYAKPAVAAAAHCAINHTDLTSALYFQGYREDEFSQS